MRTYTIHRKKGSAIRLQAHGYTEVENVNRIYFHKREDKTDRDSFMVLDEVSGIDEEQPPLSPQEEEERMLSSPAFEDALRRMLTKIEKRRADAKTG